MEYYSRNIKKEKIITWIVAAVTFLVVFAVVWYIACPAINIRETRFFFLVGISLVAALVVSVVRKLSKTKWVKTGVGFIDFGEENEIRIMGIALITVIVLFVVMELASSPIFNARKYRERIDITTNSEEEFATDIPSVNNISKIALMDTKSARMLGDRVLGGLSDVVSQFEIKNYYTIEVNGNPMKIAPLEYGGFFKWISNRGKGIPGYVLVDPITSEAKYVKVNGGIKYAPSGVFSDDLVRHLRSRYPSKLFGEYTFQIDNEGNPYWVMSTLKLNTLFGCETANGAIVCDAVTGDCEYYNLENIPEWVDIVFSGEMIESMYDDYGRFINGFINFSKKGMTQTTDDYGYLCMGSDIYIYTGVTSTSSDESNLGFILVNSRTGKYNYYPISGAEEYSAMSAAEGAVQNFGYSASFPSLVNVGGVPTYVMVLKDSSNLVKMYAMVNVKNYTIVSCSGTLNDCIKSYNTALKNAGTSANVNIKNDEKKTDNFEVSDIRYVTIDGNTFVYITGDNGKIYRQMFALNEKIIFVNVGDTVIVEYADDDDVIEIDSIKKR